MFAAFQSAESRYQQWVAEHYRFLLRSAWALTGSRAVAEDVVQDCFALAWRHRKQLRDPTLARAWLFQIMRRQVQRHRSPEQLLPLHESEEAASVPAPCEGLELRLDVLGAMARLATIHREVLVLYYFDDMPTQQMAEALEIAPGTVLSRLARARDALRAVLDPPPPGRAPVPAPAPIMAPAVTPSVIALRKV